MRTLAQATWLNDEVISMWLGLLNVRALAAAGNVKEVHFFETHFFAKLCDASCAVPAEPRLSKWPGGHGTGTS